MSTDSFASICRIRSAASVDDTAAGQVLDAVRTTAQDPDANTMPVLIDAVRVYLTEGEIVDALADVFGHHTRETVI